MNNIQYDTPMMDMAACILGEDRVFVTEMQPFPAAVRMRYEGRTTIVVSATALPERRDLAVSRLLGLSDE